MKGQKVKAKVQERPAESAALAAAIVALLASVGVELTPGQYQIVVAVLAVIPAAVTWWKSRQA